MDNKSKTKFGLYQIFSEFFSQSHNILVNDVAIKNSIRANNRILKEFAGMDLALILCQQPQQFKLGGA